MDRLELDMGDGGLGEGLQILTSAEDAQVGDESRNLLARRRHEGGPARVRMPAADPALDRAQAPGVRVARQQERVDVIELRRPERPVRKIEGISQGRQIRQHRPGRGVLGRARLAEGETVVADPQPLDARACNRLDAKEGPGQRPERRPVAVERASRLLCPREIGGERGMQGGVPVGDGPGDVGPVGEAHAIGASAGSPGVTGPEALYEAVGRLDGGSFETVRTTGARPGRALAG